LSDSGPAPVMAQVMMMVSCMVCSCRDVFPKTRW
jgi:hypothetical protein